MRWGVGLLAAALVVSGPAGAAAQPAASPQPGMAHAAPPTVTELTLITGDRVRFGAVPRAYEFRPGKGREQMGYELRTVGDRDYVIPADALRLVATGQLDERLFDVTERRQGNHRPWDELTEPAPMAGGSRLGTRQPRAGTTLEAAPKEAPKEAPTAAPTAAAEDVELTIVFTDRTGAPTADASSWFGNLDTATGLPPKVAPGPDGVAKLRLPKARYLMDSTVSTPRPGSAVPDRAKIVQPTLTVDRDLRITVDARTAKPLSVTVPDPQARFLYGAALYSRPMETAGGGYNGGISGPSFDGIFTAHQGPPADKLSTQVFAYLARPGNDGAIDGSPVAYGAGWAQRGSYVTGFRRAVTDKELSTVRAEHGASAPGRSAVKAMTARFADAGAAVSYGIAYPSTPFTRIERYAGDARWSSDLHEFVPGQPPTARVVQRTMRPVAYAAGRSYHERWNAGPLRAAANVGRLRDHLSVGPALYGDQSAGHIGQSEVDSAHLTLHRDGTLVGEADRLNTRFDVPAQEAGYRLTATARRTHSDLATQVDAAWTFRSAHAAGAVTPGLMSVRYAPPVDLSSAMPSGRVVPMPVHVERDGDGSGPAVRSLSVDASFDDGKSWQRLPLVATGNHWLALLRLPAGPDFVSLRSKATDAAGDTAEHTVIHAARLTAG